MQQYEILKDQHTKNFNRLQKQFSSLALLRLLLIVFMLITVYKFISYQEAGFLSISLLLVVAFASLIRWHQKIKYKRNIEKKLIEINAEELAYLNQRTIPFEEGKEYVETHHLYTYDLDIFGPKSLFHHLNRTATPIGKKILAHKLAVKLDAGEIVKHQQAIKELAQKIAFRQLVNAKARIAELDQEGYAKLLAWAGRPVQLPGLFINILRIVLPLLFFIMIGLTIYTGHVLFTYLANTCFLLNLCVFAIYLKQIKNELIEADKIHETINEYALILELIEHEEMHAAYLNQLKKELTFNGTAAHIEFQKLSKLFNNLASMQNPVGAVFFNGVLLYHLSVYRKLMQWKKQFAHEIEKNLHVLGTIEALNSLANFSYNNPVFAFPELNNNFTLSFKNCGHPLIHASKRICNDVEFKAGNFMILTGSNMSGKSTFLRTLGINMVLANAGAPVCAGAASIHSLPVIVSMRMSDSLTDSESYFFAEVKRLKQIMNELDEQSCFVLLDEILKGTNSDDKRTGTIKVVEKMVMKKAIGAIATHDLEVCNITAVYPEQLSNHCFEVEIEHDELVFDYKLRPGVCKNKSATFLMNKMEII